MKLCSLRSGSRGNAVLIYTDKTGILIDCGVSGKEAEKGMAEIGFNPGNLSAILVTHEHNDHVSGVGVMARRYRLPIYANKETWFAMEDRIGKLDFSLRKYFENHSSFTIGDIKVNPFAIPHDAANPVGYSFYGCGKKISIATDIGYLEDNIFQCICGSDTVLLESNHDKNMLEIGPYPLSLKQRIRGQSGHLSNDEAGKAAEILVRTGTNNILLGHLSHENNYPLLAEQTVANALCSVGIDPKNDINLCVAPRDCVSAIY